MYMIYGVSGPPRLDTHSVAAVNANILRQRFTPRYTAYVSPFCFFKRKAGPVSDTPRLFFVNTSDLSFTYARIHARAIVTRLTRCTYLSRRFPGHICIRQVFNKRI